MHFYDKYCRTHCDCGSYLKDTGRVAEVLMYTRNGSFKGRHAEYRCASKQCRTGHFYGFTTKGRKIHYDNNCLERPFFFTSRKTGYHSLKRIFCYFINIKLFQVFCCLVVWIFPLDCPLPSHVRNSHSYWKQCHNLSVLQIFWTCCTLQRLALGRFWWWVPGV